MVQKGKRMDAVTQGRYHLVEQPAHTRFIGRNRKTEPRLPVKGPLVYRVICVCPRGARMREIYEIWPCTTQVSHVKLNYKFRLVQ